MPYTPSVGTPMTESQAKIDDHLVRQHVLMDRVRRLIASHTIQTLSLSEYLRLLGGIRTLPADVRPALARMGQHLPPEQADLVQQLLGDLETTASLEVPTGEPGARVIPMLPGDGNANPTPAAIPLPEDLLWRLAEDRGCTGEELGILWLERFMPCAAEERLPILERLLAHAAPRCTAVLRLEWHWGDLAGDPRLTELGQRHFPRFPMPWMEFPRASGGVTPTRGALEAWGASVDETGHAVAIISRRELDDTRTFAVLLLDLWHHGIEDVWGNSRVAPSALASVKENFITLEPDVAWRSLRAHHAAGLVQQAHRLSVAACQLVPGEFWVWADLYAVKSTPPQSLRRLWRPPNAER